MWARFGPALQLCLRPLTCICQDHPEGPLQLPSHCRRLPWNRQTPPTAASYPPTAIGHPSTAVGYSPTAVGYPPTAAGYPPTAFRYPPTAFRYPPTAVGCPPIFQLHLAVAGSFFFFLPEGLPCFTVGVRICRVKCKSTSSLLCFSSEGSPVHSPGAAPPP